MNALLQSRASGVAGLLIGGGSVVASVAAFFKLLSDADYLSALYHAIVHAHQHALTPDDVHTYAQLVASTMGMVGAVVLALIMTFLSRGPNGTAAEGDALSAARALTTDTKGSP